MHSIALIVGFALWVFGVVCWFTAVISFIRAYLNRKPDASPFWARQGMLFCPDLFTEVGQRHRKMGVRAIQGFIAVSLSIPAVFIKKAYELPPDNSHAHLAFYVAMAVGILLVLAVLEVLRRL